MNETECYAVFSRALLSISPAGFEQARLSVEIHEGWTKKSYQHCVDGIWSQGVSVNASLDFGTDDALHALREQTGQDGKPNWTRCTFTLEPNGTFKLAFTRPN